MSAAQIGALVACVVTAGVVFHTRHATSQAARIAASIAGGACLFLLGVSGLLDFSEGGSGHVIGAAAPFALGGYLLRSPDTLKKHLGFVVVTTSLAAALPASEVALAVVVVTFFAVFIWPLVADRVRQQ